jgi:hypothetical protein
VEPVESAGLSLGVWRKLAMPFVSWITTASKGRSRRLKSLVGPKAIFFTSTPLIQIQDRSKPQLMNWAALIY